jgi:hypothetical protein
MNDLGVSRYLRKLDELETFDEFGLIDLLLAEPIEQAGLWCLGHLLGHLGLLFWLRGH